MTPPTNPPGSSDRTSGDVDLDSWLAALRGEPGVANSAATAQGERLRHVVLEDFEETVEQITDHKLNAGWNAIAAQLSASRASRVSNLADWSRRVFDLSTWFSAPTLATGIAGLMLGAILVPSLLTNPRTISNGEGAQLLLTVGEVSRGTAQAQTVVRDVADPVEASSILAEDLAKAGLGFQLYRIAASGEQQVAFSIDAPLAESIRASLVRLGIDVEIPGLVLVRFIPK